jgi:hypothetical protein
MQALIRLSGTYLTRVPTRMEAKSVGLARACRAWAVCRSLAGLAGCSIQAATTGMGPNLPSRNCGLFGARPPHSPFSQCVHWKTARTMVTHHDHAASPIKVAVAPPAGQEHAHLRLATAGLVGWRACSIHPQSRPQVAAKHNRARSILPANSAGLRTPSAYHGALWTARSCWSKHVLVERTMTENTAGRRVGRACSKELCPPGWPVGGSIPCSVSRTAAPQPRFIERTACPLPCPFHGHWRSARPMIHDLT